MSTTFEVWPRSSQIPKTGLVLDRVQEVFAVRCYEMGIKNVPEVCGHLHARFDNAILEEPMDATDDFSWHSDNYLWLFLKDHPGGTDVNFRENNDLDIECWNSDVIPKHNNAWTIPALQDCLKPGYHWSFRRSAGQPGVINVLYALAAGCLAELVEGAVYSSDNAWDYDKLPMTGIQALEELMRPRTSGEFSQWASRSEEDMRRTLSS